MSVGTPVLYPNTPFVGLCLNMRTPHNRPPPHQKPLRAQAPPHPRDPPGGGLPGVDDIPGRVTHGLGSHHSPLKSPSD